jgi:hypothetical protein
MEKVLYLIGVFLIFLLGETHSQDRDFDKFLKSFVKDLSQKQSLSKFISPDLNQYDTLLQNWILIDDYYLETKTDTTFTVLSKTLRKKDYCTRTTFKYAKIKDEFFIFPSRTASDNASSNSRWYDPWIEQEIICNN